MKPLQRAASDRPDLVFECTIEAGETGLFPYLPQSVFKLTRIEQEQGPSPPPYLPLVSLTVGVEEQLTDSVPLAAIVEGSNRVELAVPAVSPGTVIMLKVGNPTSEPVTLRLRLHGYEVK